MNFYLLGDFLLPQGKNKTGYPLISCSLHYQETASILVALALIDDPKDTVGIQEHMSVRIRNNAIGFSSIDHIHHKSTPNLEIINNSVFTESDHADGITDRQGDTNTPKFTYFIFENKCIRSGKYTR